MFNIVKCEERGLIYLNPRPTSESILELYKEDYRLDEKTCNIGVSREEPEWKKILRPFWHEINGYYSISEIYLKGRFLDVGWYMGNTLEVARETGAEFTV